MPKVSVGAKDALGAVDQTHARRGALGTSGVGSRTVGLASTLVLVYAEERSLVAAGVAAAEVGTVEVDQRGQGISPVEVEVVRTRGSSVEGTEGSRVEVRGVLEVEVRGTQEVEVVIREEGEGAT